MTGVSRTSAHGDRLEASEGTRDSRPGAGDHAPSDTDAEASSDRPTAGEQPTRRRRVPAMAPEERRAAIIAATVPLLREHGLAVSTKQIAAAAGVAEGTLFGVFPDKSSLLRATIIRILEPSPIIDELDALRSVPDLRARLVRAAKIMDQRFTDNAPLIGAVREFAPTDTDPASRTELFAALTAARERFIAALVALVEPDRHRLRRSPESTATLFLLLLMGKLRGVFGDTGPIDGAEIVSLLLDGLLLPRPSPGAAPDQPDSPPSPESEGANG